MKHLLIAGALSLVAFSNASHAEQVVMSYDGFYDRMEVVKDGDYQWAQVGFYLKTYEQGSACEIQSGEIITERQQFDLTYTDDAKLLLPFDKLLDTHKAVVIVNPSEKSGSCLLSMQLEAVGPFNSISSATLNDIHTEFESLLSDLSGFFVSTFMPFMLPDVAGLNVHFNDESAVFDMQGVQCSQSRCSVPKEVLAGPSANTLLSHIKASSIERITPWILK